MQKQKKISAQHQNQTKIKPKSNRGYSAYQWTQQNFKQLYPQQPQLQTSSTFFTIGLNYKGNLLKVKLPTGINNNSLPYFFHKQIYKFLLNIKDSNPLLKTAQVIGFQTVDGNLLLDYQISIGKGILGTKQSFNCLEYIAQGRLKKYKIYKCLAIGGFSKVYLVRSLKDGNFYAMKVMLKKFISSTQKQSIIQNEKSISSQLNHPFIVRLNHAFETTNFVCLVLDYCPGGELFFYLKQVKRMSEQDARFYFIQILYGLLYLHQQKIIYRDLKPQNLLINHDGHVKIADFGLSKQNMKQKELTYSFCGSTQYMPPQMILRQGHSFGVDFYTLGALLYQLVTGLPPFYSKDQEQIKQSIINQQLSFPDHIHLSSQIKNLLTGLLHKNQKMRIGSMRGLKQILFHPWIGKMNSELILSKQLVPPYVPPIDEFNFDQNQLGQDQEQFTRALMTQHLIPQSKQILIYKDFQFLNERQIKIQVKAIYDKYGIQNSNCNAESNKKYSDNDQKDRQMKQDRKKNMFKKCNSLKNLKNRNTCDQMDKNKLKRQASSPYLRSASTNHTNSNLKKHKALLANSSPQKIFKNLLNIHSRQTTNHSKDGITRSLSKKNLKNSYKNSFNIDKSLGNLQGYTKPLKKKSTNGNTNATSPLNRKTANKQNFIDPQLMQYAHKLSKNNASSYGNGSNGFLKKKKLVYNYGAN